MLFLSLIASSLALAEPDAPATSPEEATPPAEDAGAAPLALTPPSLEYRTGQIELPSGVASLSLGDGDRYLDPKETSKLLVLWGNPPDQSTEGAIVPAGSDPLEAGGWAVILTYTDDGHVSDEDAAEIDYDELLKQMQSSTADANAAREQQGYGSVELVGWATPPSYDSSAKKLLWAKTLRFGLDEPLVLNYDVRVLGRKGVLSMNAVASMEQLADVQRGMEQLLPRANFNAGQRYADFDESTDELAGYGIAALVAGGLAAKTGLLAKLGVVLASAWKLIAVGVAALAAFARKLFTRSSSKSPIQG
jgi:uncharacterized membrane-anchored protein